MHLLKKKPGMIRSGKAFAAWVCCLFGVMACVTTPTEQLPRLTPDQALQKRLAEQLAIVASDSAARQQLNQAMKFRTRLCQRCHGADGHSRNGRCPNLAGQNPGYLLQQLQHFHDGRRQDFQMQSMVRHISDADKIAVSIYFSSMPPRPASTEENDQTAEGKRLFHIRCAQCHGAQGQGLYTYPRLAGQLPEYIRITLHEFRKPDSRRRTSIMREIASILSEREINALAAYISTME